MKGSLRALMSELIDYAGLYPPASLDLEAAVRQFREYADGPDAWMLGRFIGPVARFEALAPLLPQDGAPMRLSAICGQSDTPAEWSAQVCAAMRTAAQFAADHPVRIEAFETRMPLGPRFAIREAFRAVLAELAAGPLAGAPVFIETARDEQWRDAFSLVIGEIADAADPALGFKLRCGGVTPDAFPTGEQVAFAIRACATAAVPIKFTAGLHHPIRHFNDGVGCDMHGFINVFTAALLATARGADRDALTNILETRDAGAFMFTDDGLRFADMTATTAEIESLRKRVTSFGSCSFDEPRDDLSALGWR